MSQKNRSPFDDFWSFSQPSDEKKGPDETNSPNFSNLLDEVNKTWKSISPVVKPMIDKFKK